MPVDHVASVGCFVSRCDRPVFFVLREEVFDWATPSARPYAATSRLPRLAVDLRQLPGVERFVRGQCAEQRVLEKGAMDRLQVVLSTGNRRRLIRWRSVSTNATILVVNPPPERPKAGFPGFFDQHGYCPHRMPPGGLERSYRRPARIQIWSPRTTP